MDTAVAAVPGKNCRAGCRSRDHLSWGACARAGNLQIDKHSLKVDVRLEKEKDNRLDRYASLRKHKIQPAGTSLRQVQHAEEHGSVRESTARPEDLAPLTAPLFD